MLQHLSFCALFGFLRSTVAPIYGLPVFAIASLTWKTTLNAVRKTELSPFLSFALHSTAAWKLYWAAHFLSSSFVTTSFILAGSFSCSLSSLRSILVPTRMHGQDLAVALTSAIHLVHACLREFLSTRLKHTKKQSVFV